jgi:hypothetical protein
MTRANIDLLLPALLFPWIIQDFLFLSAGSAERTNEQDGEEKKLKSGEGRRSTHSVTALIHCHIKWRTIGRIPLACLPLIHQGTDLKSPRGWPPIASSADGRPSHILLANFPSPFPLAAANKNCCLPMHNNTMGVGEKGCQTFPSIHPEDQRIIPVTTPFPLPHVWLPPQVHHMAEEFKRANAGSGYGKMGCVDRSGNCHLVPTILHQGQMCFRD